MTPGAEEALIPLWAADIRESVAEIRGLTGQIPGIITRLENLQATQIPATEYAEVKRKVEAMWDERSQVRGAVRLWKGAVYVLGAVLTALSLFTLVHNAGITISVK